jgi:hypothetical protein
VAVVLGIDGGSGRTLYLDDEQKPGHLRLFMTFEVGFEHYRGTVGVPGFT